MIQYRYKVFIGKELVAENVPLNEALIFVKALFLEYYKESSLEVRIISMDLDEGNCSDE